MPRFIPAALIIATALSLGACSSGGSGAADMDDDDMVMGPEDDDGGESTPSPGATDPDSLPNTTDPTASVLVFQQNTTGDPISFTAGIYDGTTDIVSIDGLDIALDSASPLNANQFYTAVLEPGTTNRIIYVPTDILEIPTSGSSTYTGTAEVLLTLTDASTSSGTYSAIMDASLAVDFSQANSGDLSLETVADATFVDAADPTAPASDYEPNGGELITVEGWALTSTGLANGSATVAQIAGFGFDEPTIDVPTSDIEAEAGFAGQDAVEIAGGVQIDTTGAVARLSFVGSQ